MSKTGSDPSIVMLILSELLAEKLSLAVTVQLSSSPPVPILESKVSTEDEPMVWLVVLFVHS